METEERKGSKMRAGRISSQKSITTTEPQLPQPPALEALQIEMVAHQV